jgi:uncharacterized membrane protein (DUF485 family)
MSTSAPRPAAGDAEIDWAGIASTPEFKALHESRRRYTLIGFAIQTGALLVLMALLGFAPDAMSKSPIGDVTWALLGGVAVVLLTFVMAIAYARKSGEWEEMAAGVLDDALPAERDARFAR